MLVAYATALAPWAYMAQKEQNDQSGLVTFFAAIGCVVMLLGVLLGEPLPSMGGLAGMFIPVIGVSFLIQLGLAFAMLSGARRNA